MSVIQTRSAKKRTRHLNLFLTIPAMKLNDLSKQLWNIKGSSDADWAGDPVTRKSTSCTLHSADQFLLTREYKGPLSSGESEIVWSWVRAQDIMKEIGLSFLIHARADSSAARAVATKQGTSRKDETHSCTIPIHSRFSVPETADDVRNQDRCESE